MTKCTIYNPKNTQKLVAYVQGRRMFNSNTKYNLPNQWVPHLRHQTTSPPRRPTHQCLPTKHKKPRPQCKYQQYYYCVLMGHTTKNHFKHTKTSNHGHLVYSVEQTFKNLMRPIVIHKWNDRRRRHVLSKPKSHFRRFARCTLQLHIFGAAHKIRARHQTHNWRTDGWRSRLWNPRELREITQRNLR